MAASTPPTVQIRQRQRNIDRDAHGTIFAQPAHRDCEQIHRAVRTLRANIPHSPIRLSSGHNNLDGRSMESRPLARVDAFPYMCNAGIRIPMSPGFSTLLSSYFRS